MVALRVSVDPCGVYIALANGNLKHVEDFCVSCYYNCVFHRFSARQDAEHPESWLMSRCPCPTCRSPFCVLDVSLVETVENI